MGPSSGFIVGGPGLSCKLISVSLIVRFVLSNFSKFATVLSFYVWSLVVVVFSMLSIVQLNLRNQSIPSSDFMSSHLVIRFIELLLIHLRFVSIVMFPLNFTSFFTVLIVSCYRWVKLSCSLLFPHPVEFLTGDPVSTINFFSVPSVFTAMLM